MKKFSLLTSLTVSAVLICPVMGHASVNIMKVYREINPDLKADCTYCHTDKLPKKDDGKHELNPYGAKIKEMIEADKKDMSEEQGKEIYTSVLKQLGRHDAFKADAATGK